MPRGRPQHVVLVTGPAGAGRSTAIHALEDLGFEAIDNLPLRLLPRVLADGGAERPIALGIDTRTRGFSVEAVEALAFSLRASTDVEVTLLYLDCQAETLVRRFSETRRRHPLAPDEAPLGGVEQELQVLRPVRDIADIVIDTTGLTPHGLRAEIGRLFGHLAVTAGMVVTVVSFSYRRGLPVGADMVFDCRFLRNPHWETALRPLDGRDDAVREYVAADPNFARFVSMTVDYLALTVPAFEKAGKSHLQVAFGCTGGRHRSVAVAETVRGALEDTGWRVSIEHRELERRADGPEGAKALGVGET
ncbi:MAG: RNase adapter RapZ [Alphaproteobacteria bacterium]|nr:MAG: RNase adapter RapZ [Alphaproteobacteria bacterium]